MPIDTMRLRLILKESADFFNIPVEILKKKDRYRAFVEVRSAYYYAARAEGFGFKSIADQVNRTHGTVVTMLNRLNQYTTLKSAVEFYNHFRQKYPTHDTTNRDTLTAIVNEMTEQDAELWIEAITTCHDY